MKTEVNHREMFDMVYRLESTRLFDITIYDSTFNKFRRTCIVSSLAIGAGTKKYLAIFLMLMIIMAVGLIIKKWWPQLLWRAPGIMNTKYSEQEYIDRCCKYGVDPHVTYKEFEMCVRYFKQKLKTPYANM